MSLSLLYRGPLSSCNYGCDYCPFAKQVDTRQELVDDAQKLTRFVDWVCQRQAPTSVFFTPWGEALIRPAYQDALKRLTKSAHIDVASIQTNLSCELGWTKDCEPSKLGIWATYHDEWCKRDGFVAKVRRLSDMGVRISVGVVGFAKFASEIEQLRSLLPSEVYLWINAAKSSQEYSESLIQRFEAVDPHFRTNTTHHPSLGRSCHAGENVVSVNGEGDVRRCHFVEEHLGNIYQADVEDCLAPRTCPNQSCGCHIGYVHLKHLKLGAVYGSGILERVPSAKRSKQSKQTV